MKNWVVLPLLLAGIAFGQETPRPNGNTGSVDVVIDGPTRGEAIDRILKALGDFYVFPEAARKMTQAIREREQRKEYDSITSGKQLAQTLTKHLQEVSRDKHVRVAVVAGPQAQPRDRQPPVEELEQQRVELARTNFGFERVERLAGNIGYVDLRVFHRPGLMGETAAAAMNFLAHTDALIADLRQNTGGDPAAVALISSYLFGPEPVHLNDIYWRPSNETRQWWTLPYVPGKRLADRDVYVLTSRLTFSAGEEFAYNLKSLKRATIVGESTAGGAHPGGPQRVHDHFVVFVPMGRAINPVTKSNWEGTGVEPDFKVAADQALKTAHLIALEKAASKGSGDKGVAMPADSVSAHRLRGEITAAIQVLKKELGDAQEQR